MANRKPPTEEPAVDLQTLEAQPATEEAIEPADPDPEAATFPESDIVFAADQVDQASSDERGTEKTHSEASDPAAPVETEVKPVEAEAPGDI